MKSINSITNVAFLLCATGNLFFFTGATGTSSSSSSSSSSSLTSSQDHAVTDFVRSLANYGYMKYERCLRVKIPQQKNNDDDGNSYFYNGAYRSQSIPYVAYKVCNDHSMKNCDDDLSYLAPLQDVIYNQATYTQNYCNSCSEECIDKKQSNNNNGNGNYGVNCKTCIDECKALLNNNNDNQNDNEKYDETQALSCQPAFEDEDGLQYYSSTSCDDKGQLTIGLFYDDECTVKKDDVSGYGENFAYNTFHALENIIMDCTYINCDTVQESLICLDGQNQNENYDDEMYACKAYKKVTKEWIYAKARREKNVGLICLGFIIVGFFLFGSYTYYVRHKNHNNNNNKHEKKGKIILEDVTEVDDNDYAAMT